jgi:hypothetical protein
MVSMNRTIRGSVDMTTVCVRAPSRKYLTSCRVSPGVMPVAEKTTSSPRIKSSKASFCSGSSRPYSLSFSTYERCVGHTLAWISPPRHFITAAARMPSGAPPDTDDGVKLRSAQAHSDDRRQVALLADLDARRGIPYLLDQVLVPGPV